MRAFARYTIALLIAYLLALTAAFVFVMLTFRGFEAPALVLPFSIVAFVPLAGMAIFLAKKFGR